MNPHFWLIIILCMLIMLLLLYIIKPNSINFPENYCVIVTGWLINENAIPFIHKFTDYFVGLGWLIAIKWIFISVSNIKTTKRREYPSIWNGWGWNILHERVDHNFMYACMCACVWRRIWTLKTYKIVKRK